MAFRCQTQQMQPKNIGRYLGRPVIATSRILIAYKGSLL